MRQKQPQLVRMKHGGPTQGAGSRKTHSLFNESAVLVTITANFWAHMGNIYDNVR